MTIACKWNWHNTGHQVWYDKSTLETLKTTFPVQFVDDFVGDQGGSVFDGTMRWDVIDAGAATEAIVADSSNGAFALTLTSASEAQDAGLFQGDHQTFDVGNGLIFEARIDMSVSPGTGVVAVAGMAGPHNLDKDTVANAAWFRWDASLVTKVESDDTTNNNDDVATGLTAVAATYNIYRIDFTTLADVKFFVDGVRVASGTTFDMSNLSAAEQQMQPYFSLDKASGTALGTMTIDYVKIFSNRA